MRSPACPVCGHTFSYLSSFRHVNPFKIRCPECGVTLTEGRLYIYSWDLRRAWTHPSNVSRTIAARLASRSWLTSSRLSCCASLRRSMTGLVYI